MGRVLRVAVVIVSALSLQLFAQQAKVLAPHRPIAPKIEKRYPMPAAVQGSMVGGPWIVDASFDSSIFLRNVVETSAVTITPILYLSNGTKYTLTDVPLQPSQTTTIDLKAALANLGIAPYASLSGYVELKYTWPWDPICATIRNLDTVHSLIFNYPLRPSKAMQIPNQPAQPTVGTKVAEGMWWKQEANVTGFVALANTTNQLVHATVELSDGQGQGIAQHEVAVSSHGTKTINLDELATATTGEGGIRVTYAGSSTDLLISGGLEDQVVGYSAVLPFTIPSGPTSSSAGVMPTSVAEIGLMSGPADPMMKFPAGIVFTPYSVLRNSSTAPLTVTPTLWWMSGGMAQSAQMPALTLAAYQTRTLDVPAMLASVGLKNYSGNVNLVFDLHGNVGGLLMAGGSVDQNDTYVFEVTPHGVTESASKSLSYWSTGNGDDTMVTFWNPADEAQDLVFRLTFTGGQYLFPVHLDPRATQSLNISDVVQNQVPDTEGNVIPLGINEGGAVLSGSQADNQDILVVMDAGAYNVKKATCGSYCATCNGATSFLVAYSPFVVAAGSHIQETMYGNWNNGSQINYTSSSNWSSSNTSSATVSSGVVAGVIPGNPNISAILVTSVPGYISLCEGGYFSCPVFFTDGPASTPGNVVSITINGVGPSAVLGSTGGLTISGTNFNYLTPPVNITTDGGLVVGNAEVQNATTIQATYNATNCSILAGTQHLWIQATTTDGGQLSTNQWPISVVLPSAPAPAIFFNGNNITGTTQSVVVGQQIGLSASVPSLPGCMSFSSQQWSMPPGPAVGGYAASSASGSVVSLPPNTNSSYLFYWITSGNSRSMSYQYSMSGGGATVNSPGAAATFNVNGPTTPNVTAVTSAVVVSQNVKDVNGNPLPFLSFGTEHGTYPNNLISDPVGIDFTASVTEPSGYPDADFQWVQLLTAYTEHLIAGSTRTCSGGLGMDGTYPYSLSNETEDSPGFGLGAPYTEINGTMSFTMYLMWTSGLSQSIPVPLGYVTWSWSGDASSNGTWSLVSGSGGPTNASQPFTASDAFPTWTSPTQNPTCTQ